MKVEEEIKESDSLVIFGFGKTQMAKKDGKLNVFFSRTLKTVEAIDIKNVDRSKQLRSYEKERINKYIKQELHQWKASRRIKFEQP